MRWGHATDKGMQRPQNEDCYMLFFREVVDNEQDEPVYPFTLAAVADGMGGHLAGEVASSYALEELERFFNEKSNNVTPKVAKKLLSDAVELANKVVYKASSENPDYKGMGTTITAALVIRDACWVASVGDSRAYLIGPEKIEQITNDHTLVNELLQSGSISEKDAEVFPNKNILTRALGVEGDISVDTAEFIFEDSQAVLLCSDGLTDMLEEKEMLSVMNEKTDVQEKAMKLVKLANENGGKDNITVVIGEAKGSDNSSVMHEKE